MCTTILIAKGFCAFWALFFGVYGLLTSIWAGLSDQTFAVAYFGIYAFTSFWCGLLMLMVTIRLHKIPPVNNSDVNKQCYKDSRTLIRSILYHDDYFIQRRIALFMLITLFFVSVVFVNIMIIRITLRSEGDGAPNQFLDQRVRLAACLIPSILIGAVTIIYMVCIFIQMVVDFKSYQNDIIFQLNLNQQEPQNKMEIFIISNTFCLIAVLYYIAKTTLYIIFGSIDMACDFPYSILVIISSILSVLLFGWIGFSLIFINKQKELQKHNLQYLNGWFTLVVSVMFSKKQRYLTFIIMAFLLAQTGYGLVAVPFYDPKVFFESSNNYAGSFYIFWDNTVTTFQVFWNILEMLLKYMHGERLVNKGFLFSLNVCYLIIQNVAIQVVEKNIDLPSNQDYISVEQQLVNDKLVSEKGLCVLCNKIMMENQLLEMSKCSFTHSFHKNCLDIWMTTQKACPGCKTEQ